MRSSSGRVRPGYIRGRDRVTTGALRLNLGVSQPVVEVDRMNDYSYLISLSWSKCVTGLCRYICTGAEWVDFVCVCMCVFCSSQSIPPWALMISQGHSDVVQIE